MRREWLVVGAIWAALTAAGEYAVSTWSMLPDGYSRESEVVNEAYVLLLALAVPVFSFVVAMLSYSIIAFRSSGQPSGWMSSTTGRSAGEYLSWVSGCECPRTHPIAVFRRRPGAWSVPVCWW